MYPPVDPIIFHIGPLALRWYGVLMLTAILAAALVASREVARKGEDSENLWDMLFWILIPGFLGARLYYVFIQSPRGESGLGYYLQNPGEILKIWGGGIHIFGGFIAGSIALWLFTRIRKLNPLPYLDAIALGLPLAQAIGRWGNFINQELYGPPTTLPWGLRIDPQHRIPPYNDLSTYPESARFHPLFLYESLWNFLGFAILFWISRRFQKDLKEGDIALLYLIWYPLGRFFIEFLRTDSWFFPGTLFNVVHILSAISVISAVIGLYLSHRPSTTQGSNV
ncbi:MULTISPECIES: prolipoprotein diacylglyceryl transferase [Cyanophyceae]|jgi:phosphatidylglycerol:prolipoprotein diacylglycerol transferase|uniref:Phosphatidylglycerol--prolipoprotein diacylglyceryl transferase n=2 Tax=Cyanophyceae TaxID=3028117 RepID=A0A4Q7ECW0_9CYAN|nr:MULTISPECIES: prolipoprotein diacylglyceryl transferase [Cyanophyceae]MCM1982140.1 prolipoprotein diacylglyceryl transferase [Lyngbya confervoides BDU141951]RZM79075.1 prolipoprotein diacylglyceryl transferase [Leptolyngbya sp. LK]